MYETIVHFKIGEQQGKPIGPVPFYHRGSAQQAWKYELIECVATRNHELPPDQQVHLHFDDTCIGSQPGQRLTVEAAMGLIEQQRLALFERSASSGR